MGGAFSPDGLPATASDDKTVKIWNPRTGDCRRTLSGHAAGLRGVAFERGRVVAAGHRQHRQDSAAMGSATSGCRYILADRMALVCDVAFSPDGQLIATGSTDATVKVWDPATGDCLRTRARSCRACLRCGLQRGRTATGHWQHRQDSKGVELDSGNGTAGLEWYLAHSPTAMQRDSLLPDMGCPSKDVPSYGRYDDAD